MKINEQERRRADGYEVKRKVISDYFLKFSRYLRPWVKKLAGLYKESGDYIVHPFMLADLYTDEQDMEIALIASLLIDEDKDIYSQVYGLKTVLGNSPWEWYMSRGFVSCGIGDKFTKIDGTEIRYHHVAELFQRLWDIEGCTYLDHENEHLTKRFFFYENDLEDKVKLNNAVSGETPFMILLNLFDCVHGIKRWYWRLNFMLIRLYRRDGLGLGLWGNGNERLQCPMNRDVERFLRTLFPDYRRYGSFEDGILLLGFEDSVDFLYAYYGYKRLCEEKPKECMTFATKYRLWYDNASNLGHKERLKGILPEIDW